MREKGDERDNEGHNGIGIRTRRGHKESSGCTLPSKKKFCLISKV